MIVRSNGVVTYVGKDIAYQFWKLGLLGRDFQYRVFAAAAAGVRCGRRAATDGVAEHPHYGGAAYVYNVIDVRQSYLQKLLKQALIAVGHPEGAQRSHHFSYEMVALSHATARELGFAPAPDSKKPSGPFVEVSGRKGSASRRRPAGHRHPEGARRKSANATRTRRRGGAQIAGLIGVAAVRYFLIKFSRGKVIAFDLEEAISFQGETGPHLVRHRPYQQHLPQAPGT